MPGRKRLTAPSDVVYLYDGGLKGFYTCVHEAVYSRQMPLDIWPPQRAQPSLLSQRWVQTDAEAAGRVRHAVRKKLSPAAQELVETVFLSCMPEKEMPLLRYLLLAFEEGNHVIRRRQNPDVAALLAAQRHLGGEAHLLKGFIRFEDFDGKLVATIRPKNFVLPFLAEHFAQRLSEETFLIYDKTHRAALIHQNGQVQIVPMEALPALEASETELLYQALWKQFYNTIAIEARTNLKNRMTHVPKRYWSEMTEMRALL